MKKIALGIIGFMFLLAIAAPLVEGQAAQVLQGNSGQHSDSWTFIAWGRDNRGAFTSHSQRHQSASAGVDVFGRRNTAWAQVGQTARAHVVAATNEPAIHTVW